MTKHICCFSGGKDSTAMLIHILENDLSLDEIIYCDVGDWIWESAKTHIQQVQDKLGVTIHIIDITRELDTGFQRWGFPGKTAFSTIVYSIRKTARLQAPGGRRPKSFLTNRKRWRILILSNEKRGRP